VNPTEPPSNRDDSMRRDLTELLRRRALTEDAARPDAVERRHRGAVRLALRRELEAMADDEAREQRVREATATMQERVKALNAAQIFEIDDVIDPAETRSLVAATLAAAAATRRPRARHRFVDTW
jgi:hypothetical protein